MNYYSNSGYWRSLTLVHFLSYQQKPVCVPHNGKFLTRFIRCIHLIKRVRNLNMSHRNNKGPRMLPIGSILGPLLFLVYIKYLFSAMYCSNAFSFADDTKCYKLILQLLDSLQLQQDLDSVSDWSRHCNFFFNSIHLSFNLKFPLPTLLMVTQSLRLRLWNYLIYNRIYIGETTIVTFLLKLTKPSVYLGMLFVILQTS